MGYWGWRPLVLGLFISSWVVGCAVVPQSASPAAPSAYPEVTLTSGRLPITPLPLLVTLTPVVIPASPLPTAADDATLPHVSPPICMTDNSGRAICFGRVDNPFDHALVGVELEARALDAQGMLIAHVIVPLVLHLIAPGGFAPYSVSFEGAPALVEARAIAATAAPYGSPAPFEVERALLRTEAGAFRVRATIINTSDQPQPLHRAVITLLNDDAQVIAFRVIAFDAEIVAPSAAVRACTVLVVAGEINGATHAVVVAE